MNLLVKEARRLQNYAGGEWRNGTGQEMVLLHAALGHAHAVLESGADELPRAVDWARSTGGPALRALSFHRRAKMVQALAKHLAQQQEALVQECFAAGATLRDIRLDCRGGLAGMQALAARAARLLPDQQVLCEGEASFDPADQTAQQGILSSCGGVAVHVTSYDFPVRGVLKRLAPALMAGVPSILRPASDTAFVAEALVRLIQQSGLLPLGAVQLVYTAVDAIPDALAEGDVLTCTGPRAQAAILRRHSKAARGEIRLQTEEDGLGAAILGPDVTAGSPAMAQFLQEMTEEITLRCGQRGNALRRILVPRALEDQVARALAQRLDSLPIGLPDDPAVSMGAMVSLRRRDEARRRLRQLEAECERVTGGGSGGLRLRSGDPSRGAFLPPVLLRCRRPMEAQDSHLLCVRGPTATILAYDDLCEALALASKNPGSCGAAVFTEDAATAQHAAACLAAFGGAIRIRSTAAAADPADGPADGTEAACPALPQEQDVLELMRPFLRATALKGPPQLLTAVTGQWIEGAAADTGEHPFRKPLSRLRPGDQLITGAREITLEEVEQFAHLTGDVFYAHMDDAAARAHPFFSRRVAHGQLVVAFANGLFVDPEPGPMLANMGSDNLRFHLPVYFGDRLHVRLTCKRVSPPSGAGFGEVTWDCAIFANDGQLAASYDLLTLVAAQWPQPKEASA